jgi:exopolysaccharide production protein ExoQ
LRSFLSTAFVAITWSDHPFVSFKRWIKILGHPLAALVILTEPYPDEAMKAFFKRSAYIILPVSILFIKYYPQWGRFFSSWGVGQNCGITLSKNELGQHCMVFGLFFFCYLLNTLRLEKSKSRRDELLLCWAFIAMVAYLFRRLHCATALMTLIVGIAIVVVTMLPFVNRKLIGVYAVAGVIAILAADATFGLFDYILDFLGKDPTLTGRTELWKELVQFDINPLFGTGFESFWTGERLQTLWAAHWWKPNQAHNGYLETYLNLGLVGLFILIGVIVTTYRKIRLEFLNNFEWGRFRLSLLAAILLYNWTEAAFKLLNGLWFIFYIIALKCPKGRLTSVETSFSTTESDEDRELTYAEEETLKWKRATSCVEAESFGN